VVDLVEDDEPEAVAEVLGAQVRRVVGRDRHVADDLLAAPELADLAVELGGELAAPLHQEVDGRHYDQRRLADRLDCLQSDDRLPRPRGEFQNTASVAGRPGVQRVLLVAPEFVVGDHVQAGGVQRVVLVVDASVVEGGDHVGVPHRGCPPPVRALVERHAREGRHVEAVAVALDAQRPVRERESDRHTPA